MNTVHDVKIIELNTLKNLTAIEFSDKIPFEVKRIFYVKDIDSLDKRGCHAHYKTKQVLICINGSIECICKDSSGNEVSYLLDSPNKGLYVPEMIWDEQIYNSKDSILLSLSSTNYDPKDYVNNIKDFYENL